MLNGDQIFFNHQKGMGVGHEMTIKTRGGEEKQEWEKVEKGNKNKGKFWQD